MKILVIGPSWVGDMMMSHSLYQLLKQHHPDAEIDVVAPAWCRALLSRMPEVRHSLEMPVGHGSLALKTRYQLAKTLRGQYDMAIVLPNSLKSALIPWFAKIAHRRGWKGESRYILLTDLRSNKQDYPLMVQRYATLAFEKGKIPSAQALNYPYPYLSISPEQQAKTREKFAKQRALLADREIIGFCPGAEFGPAKRWPHYHYASLAASLIEQGYAISLFGSNSDFAIAEQICAKLSPEQQRYCLNLAGQTSLDEVIDLIADCKAIISNDSGLMHLAAALKRPLVALYGPTSPEYTPPLSDNAIIIRLIEGGLIKVRQSEDSAEGYHQSMIDITPEMVMDKISLLLAK